MDSPKGIELLVEMNGKLGEMNGRLSGFDKKLDSVEKQTRLTNGRVTKLESKVFNRAIDKPSGFQWNWQSLSIVLASIGMLAAYIIQAL